MSKYLLSVVVAISLLGTASPVAAKPKFLKKALSALTAPVTVPIKTTKTVIGTIKGEQSPGKAISAIVVQPIQPYTAVTSEGARVINKVNHKVSNLLVSGAGTISGKTGGFIAEMALAPLRFTTEQSATATTLIDDVVHGDASLVDVLATPLATAINSAKHQYAEQANPLPDHVKLMLKEHFPSELLDSARFLIGQATISLPAAINGSKKLFGTANHAVTIDNIIVFSSDPGADYAWWTHELHHVAQYRAWGVSKFARRYMFHWKDVEADAEMKTAAIRRTLAWPE
ncbi:DUF4157 domain-containing protein [Chondromyces crocatus]|uniref:Uncharacterized protein n=1 Tax=Chondromyces crocatus TaxID=52 RepID=A0A0K1ERM0_CHOCO|nr:DUF4157 domain-containing protein [Chondromyces crocatus]AKT43555.1 uncharacterized protein CMC5_077870 [Chondromyces crocatus]